MTLIIGLSMLGASVALFVLLRSDDPDLVELAMFIIRSCVIFPAMIFGVAFITLSFL